MNISSILDVQNHHGYAVVRFFGFLDADTVEQARPVVNAKLSEACATIIVDLSHVEFLDSHGVGFFTSLLKKAHQRGGRLFFVGATAQPASVLNMVGFNGSLVTYCDDLSAAITKFSAQQGAC